MTGHQYLAARPESKTISWIAWDIGHRLCLVGLCFTPGNPVEILPENGWSGMPPGQTETNGTSEGSLSVFKGVEIGADGIER